MRDRPEAAVLGRAFWRSGHRRFVNMSSPGNSQTKCGSPNSLFCCYVLLASGPEVCVRRNRRDSQYPSKCRDGRICVTLSRDILSCFMKTAKPADGRSRHSCKLGRGDLPGVVREPTGRRMCAVDRQPHNHGSRLQANPTGLFFGQPAAKPCFDPLKFLKAKIIYDRGSDDCCEAEEKVNGSSAIAPKI